MLDCNAQTFYLPVCIYSSALSNLCALKLPVIFLIDNGSLRPEATLELRCLASKLSTRVSKQVLPVSLLHSNKVEELALFGRKAQTVKSTLRTWIASGERSFVFLPLFLGPSRAITGYLPELIREASEQAPDLNIVIANPLAGATVDVPDLRLAEILAAHVRETQKSNNLHSARIAVIDHGTPEKRVNQARNAVAIQVRDLLGATATKVAACSMERRDGDKYNFNEPLLENLGKLDGWRGNDLIVAMFFLLPGRHAGSDGDVVEICNHLVQQSVFRSIHQTPLMGKHPLLIEILADRLEEALKNF